LAVQKEQIGREQQHLETDEMRKKWAFGFEMEEMTDKFE
jgi:hypothetical protein